ncbi:MAG TPA: hypothetical protein PK453_01805 [Leptospiraceae bacterium]|nr:hypothetical protein [Leptospiraceae bacterium]HNH08394.1 hypothetical protein [Leptospiraceae bacterium]HNI94610.1 hypothetical protein [Leptospiraceae bacterium]HNN02944.1 hypothetical protein [Leptospiraceae bacterium]
MKVLSFLFLPIFFGFCRLDAKDNKSKTNVIPSALHGFYCEEGFPKGADCIPLIIEANSVFDSRMGGCNKIKDVIQKEAVYTVSCLEGESVSIKILSKDKILLKVGNFQEIRERHKQ